MATQYVINNIREPIDFEIGSDAQRRAVQNAKNLIMTRMGEVPLDRQRGFDQSLYDMPINDLQDVLMEELDRVMAWEPYVEVVSATIVRDEIGRVTFECVIEVADEAE